MVCNKNDFYNKLLTDIFKINITFKEETVTELLNKRFYCNREIEKDCVGDNNHWNGVFRAYAQNKYNFQAQNSFVPLYAYNSSNYDNHLFKTKLAKDNRLKVLAKTYENFISIDPG